MAVGKGGNEQQEVTPQPEDSNRELTFEEEDDF